MRHFKDPHTLVSRSTVLLSRSISDTKCNTPSFPHLFHKLKSNSMVFIQGAAATPNILIREMICHAKANNLKNIRTIHLHLQGDGPLPPGDEKAKEIIKPICLFTGENLRSYVNNGDAEYIPIFLNEIPLLFKRGLVVPDVALVQVSPPDRHGYCSLGTSVDVTVSALHASKYVIGQVNEFMPRTLGDGIIHISRFNEIIYHNEPLLNGKNKETSAEEEKIGSLIANNLVENGATLQMGIGSIPDAVLASLTAHQNLGIHTEMFSDGVLPLVETGVINNKMKTKHHGKIISSFAVGSPELYEFIDDNQSVNFLDVSYVNDPYNICLQPKMTAINSCIEIDITGQVCSDSIGERIFSGFGGQVDFIRGASMCPEGKPIIAFSSRTKKGKSKISPVLPPGSGVVTSRAHVHYVVTEYGIANLFGKTLQERARLLIDIAHPDDRESLEMAALKRYGKTFRLFKV